MELYSLVFCDFTFFLVSIVVSAIGLHCAFLMLPNIPLNKLTTVISNVAVEDKHKNLKAIDYCI